MYTKTKKVLIDYEVVRQDARGVRRVNLWLAGEQGWAIAATAKPGEPLEVELVGDGAYGTKVIPVAGDGNAQNPPTRDTHPDSWIVLDTQRPVVEFKVSIATSPDGRPPAPFVVEASVRDENIDPSSINFRGSYESGPMKSRWVSLFTGADLGKGTIETPFGVFVSRQPKAWGDPHTRTFAFDWTPSVACGPTTSLWVSVKDQAGNEVGGLGQIVHTALPPAAARVTGLRPVPAQ